MNLFSKSFFLILYDSLQSVETDFQKPIIEQWSSVSKISRKSSLKIIYIF